MTERRFPRWVVGTLAVYGILRRVVPKVFGDAGPRRRPSVQPEVAEPGDAAAGGTPPLVRGSTRAPGTAFRSGVRDPGRGEAGGGRVRRAAAIRQARGLAAQRRGGRPCLVAGRRGALPGGRPADRAPRGDRDTAPRVLPALIAPFHDPGMAAAHRRAGRGRRPPRGWARRRESRWASRRAPSARTSRDRQRHPGCGCGRRHAASGRRPAPLRRSRAPTGAVAMGRPRPDGAPRRPAIRRRTAARRRPGARPAAAPGPAAWQADPEADPLTTFERLVPGPVPASARHLHADVVEPSLAGPLADLLDAVADVAAGSPGASATTEPYRAAMRVARAVHTVAREASRS